MRFTTKSERHAIAPDERGTRTSADRLGSLLGSSHADSRLARFFQRTQWVDDEGNSDWRPAAHDAGELT